MRAPVALVAALLAGCASVDPHVELDAEAPPVEVRGWLKGKPGEGGGTIVMQVEHDTDVQVEIALPDAIGLDFKPASEPHVERIADREVITREWSFSGRSGHYEIPGFEATWNGPDGSGSASSPALFVDLGVKSLAEADLADIDEPSVVWTVPWRMAAAALALGGLVLGGTLLAFRGRRERALPAVPPEPPDVLALRAWQTVRRDPSLSDHDKALALSRIFREYTEAVLHFPATKYTTTETVDYLKALPHLEEGNVPRARRLLRATDRVKYAEVAPGADLFEELDADLRAFIGSTRPYGWQPPTEPTS